ncbi:cell wall-binding repeat-containing protein [Peptostreptococcus sp. D1]|uniref:cell wall-binding repeat-containing protein n=1 Tax=Peptostreptococcus sp. D1 TaxID=72304 RepID=UPI0008EAB29C|nr:cell wall-binding repeat-containing protein [Peptostreptococcus sp. D1]SFE70839.1 SH3 domain (SH3b1 type) [Peptostreptococcus sp. D1]
MKNRVIKAMTISLSILAIAGIKVKADGINFERISGGNRYLTAINISRKIENKKAVLLVNSKNFIDALPGTVLANSCEGVILLTRENNLDDNTKREIDLIKPEKVIILGGYSSVGKEIEDGLKGQGIQVQRIGGASRYETSVLIADEIEKNTDVSSYIVAANPADSVSSTALARNTMPIILIDDRNIPSKLINSNLDKIVVGGEGSISGNTFKMIKASRRISGSDRYRTSLNIAKETGYTSSIISNGRALIDALASGTLSFGYDSSILLTNNKNLDSDIKEYIKNKERIFVVGGENSVSSKLFSMASNDGNPDSSIGDKDMNTPRSKLKPTNRNTYEYWNYYNKYDNTVLYSAEEIERINQSNIQRSSYLYNIYAENASEFGVIARRTIIKEKPMGKNYVDPNTFDDYSSLSGLFPWEPIAINKYNSDKSWAYITSVDYRGWIPTKDIMKVSKEKLIELQNQSFITVISRQIRDSQGYLLDMGTKLPLLKKNGDNYIVSMPISGDGYRVRNIEINKNDATERFLPFTQSNVIKQMLKFNGEKYGWGHSNSARDCSGFIRDVYRSFGVIISRDTSTQSKDIIGSTVNFNISGGYNAKNNLLKKQKPGFSAMYLSGHTMLYLGVDENGRTYMVHQYGYRKENGKNIAVFKNEISPTSILDKNNRIFLENVFLVKDFSKIR